MLTSTYSRLMASPVLSHFVSVLIAGLMVLIAVLVAPVHAIQQALVLPEHMGTGSLLLKTRDPSGYVEAPRVATDFSITVSGTIARTVVTQRFFNPTDGWVEGVYVYPLPDGSAVDTLKMVVGNHVIVGEIHEKQQAKQIYEDAKARGQKTALMEQERSNIFTNSVANIGPSESVVVQIEYQEAVRQTGDKYSLRVPLVVGPRYNPAPELLTLSANEPAQVRDPVPDQERISPPVLDPRHTHPANPVTISVSLKPGFPIGSLVSHHHQVSISQPSPDSRLVTLTDDAVPADRDFELTWRAKPGADPAVGLFTETIGGRHFVLGIITPPVRRDVETRKPRDVIFVIDNSGSMGGPSMAQAKASLDYALSRLDPADRFNVIRFDDTMELLFSAPVEASAENVSEARRFAKSLEADGGTEMVEPLRTALIDADPSAKDRLRQVVFLTDGAIGNEQEMFEILARKLGRSRVFMVGIGSAPNTFLMTRMAEIGRGTFTHIGDVRQVESRMRELLDKLDTPAVTDIDVKLIGLTGEVTPETAPDLYRGEPLVFLAQIQSVEGQIEVSGEISDRHWSMRMPVSSAQAGKGISQLWARRKIDDAEVAASLGEISDDEADKRILEIALAHHMISRRTSLVAVDKTPARPRDAVLRRSEVPLNLPAGWDFDNVFGEAHETRHASGTFGNVLVRAAATASDQPGDQTLVLPQTATPSGLLLLIGLLTLLLSGLIATLSRLMSHP